MSANPLYFDILLTNGKKKLLRIGKTAEGMPTAMIEKWIHENLGSLLKDAEFSHSKISSVAHTSSRTKNASILISGLTFQ